MVVDDDQGLLTSIEVILVSAGMPEPVLVSDSRKVMDLVRKHPFRVILLDLIMPHINGMDLLTQIKTEFPNIECVMTTAVDDVTTATKAMRRGAYDYIVKPLNRDKLTIVISRALEKYNLRHERTLFEREQSFSDLENPNAFDSMVAEDEAMARVFRQVEVVAITDYSVVITGESGTGKEMLARVIHSISNRSNAPFLAVNMAAFSKTLFEDEFFGHKKGAYTDALDDKRGFFEAAQKGTLFLDEITDLELSLQGKLLRVIQEGEFYSLGSTSIKNVDVRIISATNRDIHGEIEKGNFRADLFYRLNMYHIEIPPLRKRRKDILPLARHFTEIYSKKNSTRIDSITPDLEEALLNHPFPGNVRELENIIASSVLIEKTNALSLSSVSTLKPLSTHTKRRDSSLYTLEEMEKTHIRKALEMTGGNRSDAAKLLGVNTTTVYRKIKKYNLPST